MHTALKLSPHIRYRLIDDETLIIKQDSNQIFVANEIGARILDLIREHHPLADIASVLSDEYDAEKEEIAGDVESFCATLVDEKILLATTGQEGE